MSKAPAFQLYAADFYTDTVSWTATEVGVYFRLLMHEWINGPLPSSMAKLARIGGVDARNMQKMWSAELANKFITDDAGMYINSRLESTRNEQRQRSEIQREKGKSGADKRWHKDIAPAIAQAQPDDSSSSSSSSSTSTTTDKNILPTDVGNVPEGSGDVSGNGKKPDPKIPACPHQEIVALYHEILPSLTRVKEWTDQRQELLRTRWKEKPERQTVEWWKLFFGYVSESDFLMGRVENFRADLEWLVRPKNFVKVIEGKYHRNGANPLVSKSTQGILGWAARERARIEANKQGTGHDDR